MTGQLLAELGCREKPIIPVLNKCDLASGIDAIPAVRGAVRISAKNGDGIGRLLEEIEKNLPVKTIRVELLLPFSQSGLAARIRRDGAVFSEEYTENGLRLSAQVGPELLAAVKEYQIG